MPQRCWFEETKWNAWHSSDKTGAVNNLACYPFCFLKEGQYFIISFHLHMKQHSVFTFSLEY